MKILIVDDSMTIRSIVKTTLEESGHIIEQATNGAEAINKFLECKPDLILIDVEMEDMSGYDVAKKIREMEKKSQENGVEAWVPLIFLSARSDEQSLALGIAAGGDDYLFKPFSKVVLNSKLKAMERIYAMRQAIIKQKALVDQMNQELLEEQIVAKSIYDNIIQSGVVKQHEFIKTYVCSKSTFNGDLAIVAKSPSGNYYIIIGDFTGHGLSAALGIIPTAELFLKLTIKGFTIEQLLIELNQKLNSILPSNIFCAGAVVEVDLNRKEIGVWNGWSPEVLCVSKDGHIKQSFDSKHMPLGSLNPNKFSAKLDFAKLEQGDKVYLFSDGFIETKNASGSLFGIEGMKAVIANHSKTNINLFDDIIKSLQEFRKDYPQQDDLTLIEISIN
jgi:two-component system, HptB-dependent secretion and biofilm response regulator